MSKLVLDVLRTKFGADILETHEPTATTPPS